MCLSLAGVHQPPFWRESTGGAVMSAWTNCPPINREAGQLRWLDPHLTSLSWEIHWGKGTKAFQYHAICICKGHQMCNGKRAIGVTRRHKELEWSLFPDARSLLPVISISALMNCWCGEVSWRKCYQQQRGFTACVKRQVVNQWQVNSDLVKCRLCAFYSVTLTMQPLGLENFQQCCFTWWRHQMESFSALLALCARNSPVPGEFPAQRPVTRSFDVTFDMRLNKRLSKQSWGWWFETLSRTLWRYCNETDRLTA